MFRSALLVLLLTAAPSRAQPGLPPAPVGVAQTAPLAEHPDAALAARMDAVLDAAHAAGTFDGVVLVRRGRAVAYRRALGLADRSWGIANSFETRFPWASVTKQVTSVLAAQLVGDGRLRFSDRLDRHLPGLRADAAGRVTLRQLLAHTSGLADVDRIAPTTVLASDSAATAATDAVLAADLDTEPGATFRYSNTETLVLARVIEAVTGQPFADVLRARILVPAGMTATDLLRDDRVEPRVPTGYVGTGAAGDPVRVAPAERLPLYGAAGALAGTADDLLRFDDALLSSRLLPPALFDTLTAADPALGFVALGVWRYTLDVGRGAPADLVERQGYIGGYRALNVLAPADDLALVILSNAGEPDLFRTYARSGFSYDLIRAALGPPDGR